MVVTTVSSQVWSGKSKHVHTSFEISKSRPQPLPPSVLCLPRRGPPGVTQRSTWELGKEESLILFFSLSLLFDDNSLNRRAVTSSVLQPGGLLSQLRHWICTQRGAWRGLGFSSRWHHLGSQRAARLTLIYTMLDPHLMLSYTAYFAICSFAFNMQIILVAYC